MAVYPNEITNVQATSIPLRVDFRSLFRNYMHKSTNHCALARLEGGAVISHALAFAESGLVYSRALELGQKHTGVAQTHTPTPFPAYPQAIIMSPICVGALLRLLQHLSCIFLHLQSTKAAVSPALPLPLSDSKVLIYNQISNCITEFMNLGWALQPALSLSPPLTMLNASNNVLFLILNYSPRSPVLFVLC